MGRSSNAAITNYDKVDTYTGMEFANSHTLIEMLLNGLIQRLSAAKIAIDCKDINRKSAAIGKSINILDGLRSALNMEDGGKIASNLDNIYDYLQRQLLLANLENRIDLLDEVTSLVIEIKEAWQGISNEVPKSE